MEIILSESAQQFSVSDNLYTDQRCIYKSYVLIGD